MANLSKESYDSRGLLLIAVFSISLLFSLTTYTHSSLNQKKPEVCYSLEKGASAIREVSCSYNEPGITHDKNSIEDSLFYFRPISINRADQQLLETVVGIGPGLARKIIKHRTVSGPFTSLESLKELPGVGEKRARNLATQIVFD